MKLKLILVVGIVAALWFGIKAAAGWHFARQHSAAIEEIVPLIQLPEPSGDPSKVFDAVRVFVNDASTHNMDAEFYSYWNESHVMAAHLLAFAKGERKEPVHIECSRRTGLMMSLLARLGYETRRVDLYDEEDIGRQHTFLEVQNPKTGRWETQDPDYDIHWRDRLTAERIAVSLKATDLDKIEPCGRTTCGWNNVAREGQQAKVVGEMLDYMVIRNEQGKRYTVHSPRVNLDSVHTYKSKSGRFCEVLKKNCRDGYMSISEHNAQALLE